MHAKLKPFLGGKFMVYGSNCWNTGNFCIFFSQKFGTVPYLQGNWYLGLIQWRLLYHQM